MSATAPWLPLAVDWHESEMWDSLPEHGINDEATDGERLAWICLLCYLRATGREQPIFDAQIFAAEYSLAVADVNNMLRRAMDFGACRLNRARIVIADPRDWGGGKSRRKRIAAATRAFVMMRDKGLCRYCANPASGVDHITPHSRGGSDDVENLVACCVTCNSKKHAKTPEEAGMALING